MKTFIIFTIIILISVLALVLFNKFQTPKTLTPTPTPIAQEDKINIKASFTIITSNIIRSFQAEKYHNKSSDVYIESPDTTIVHVTKKGITWDDFFQTLPMKLTKECLITGDAETLCNGQNGTLQFFLNDIETPNLLDQEIKDGDKTIVKFLPLQS